jgi:hypothetical protein
MNKLFELVASVFTDWGAARWRKTQAETFRIGQSAQAQRGQELYAYLKAVQVVAALNAHNLQVLQECMIAAARGKRAYGRLGMEMKRETMALITRYVAILMPPPRIVRRLVLRRNFFYRD